jgi:adenine-specific DNA-methyltransferase
METERLTPYSLDTQQTDKDKLKSVFPQCFARWKLGINMLLNLCCEYITNDFEKYKFEWKGKGVCKILRGV